MMQMFLREREMNPYNMETDVVHRWSARSHCAIWASMACAVHSGAV